MKKVVEEFNKLANVLLDNAKDEKTKEQLKRAFFAGAQCVHICILNASESGNTQEDIGSLFKYIGEQCEMMGGN